MEGGEDALCAVCLLEAPGDACLSRGELLLPAPGDDCLLEAPGEGCLLGESRLLAAPGDPCLGVVRPLVRSGRSGGEGAAGCAGVGALSGASQPGGIWPSASTGDAVFGSTAAAAAAAAAARSAAISAFGKSWYTPCSVVALAPSVSSEMFRVPPVAEDPITASVPVRIRAASNGAAGGEGTAMLGAGIAVAGAVPTDSDNPSSPLTTPKESIVAGRTSALLPVAAGRTITVGGAAPGLNSPALLMAEEVAIKAVALGAIVVAVARVVAGLARVVAGLGAKVAAVAMDMTVAACAAGAVKLKPGSS